MKVRTRLDVQRIIKAQRRANIATLPHAGAAIRLTAMRSIRKRKGASPRGTPPHTHTKRLPRSILYGVDKAAESVVIGPARTKIGPAGRVHEHGGRIKQDSFEPRPFMGPALEKTRSRLPAMWAGSIH